MIPSPLWVNFAREIWAPEALEILYWNSGEPHPSNVIAAVSAGDAREPKLGAGIPYLTWIADRLLRYTGSERSMA
jgi:hypothetical protein